MMKFGLSAIIICGEHEAMILHPYMLQPEASYEMQYQLQNPEGKRKTSSHVEHPRPFVVNNWNPLVVDQCDLDPKLQQQRHKQLFIYCLFIYLFIKSRPTYQVEKN